MKGDDIELPKLPSTEILKVENSNNHVFITGTTGLLGSELLYQHLIKGFSVYTVIRAECSKSARNRVLKQLKNIRKNREATLRKFTCGCWGYFKRIFRNVTRRI